MSEALWHWEFVDCGSGHEAVKTTSIRSRASAMCAMEDILHGSVWCMNSSMLTTDDVVMLRTVTSRLNLVNRNGALGDFQFMMLQSDPYEKKLLCDSDGNRVCTMLRKRSPIMDSFRRRGLHLPHEETSPGGQEEVDMTSFGDAVIALLGTRGYPEYNDDGDSASNGGMHPIWVAAQRVRTGTVKRT